MPHTEGTETQRERLTARADTEGELTLAERAQRGGEQLAIRGRSRRSRQSRRRGSELSGRGKGPHTEGTEAQRERLTARADTEGRAGARREDTERGRAMSYEVSESSELSES